MEKLLNVYHKQIYRAAKRKAELGDSCAFCAFAKVTKVTRSHAAQAQDYCGWGRRVAIEYWHKATRLDTRLGQKKRHRETNPVTGETF